jgi:hypothetical protein
VTGFMFKRTPKNLVSVSSNTRQSPIDLWAKSGLDSGEPYSRVVVEFIRRQPGGPAIASAIASDIDECIRSLPRREEAEGEQRLAAVRQRLNNGS